MKRRNFSRLVLVFFFVFLFFPFSGQATEKPLVIGFEGDAATLDPNWRKVGS